MKAVQLMILLSLIALCSCANPEVVSDDLDAGASAAARLKIKGTLKLASTDPYFPPDRIVFQTGGAELVSGMPANREMMRVILRNSNFCPTRVMMGDLLSLAFGGRNSIPPTGDRFKVSKKNNVTEVRMETVGGTGWLWRARVIQDPSTKTWDFLLVRSSTFFPELMLAGG